MYRNHLKNTIPVSQIDASKFGNPYHVQRLNEAIAHHAAVSELVRTEPLLVSLTDGDEGGFEWAVTTFKQNGLTFEVKPKDYHKKYYIFCLELSALRDKTSEWDRESAENKFETPKNIGVLTGKKIDDWVQYYTNIYNELIPVVEAHENKISSFLKSIENENVDWSFDKKSGEIIKNGIKFSFRIEDTYVSTNIELYYAVGSSLTVFHQLADNKYQPTK